MADWQTDVSNMGLRSCRVLYWPHFSKQCNYDSFSQSRVRRELENPSDCSSENCDMTSCSPWGWHKLLPHQGQSNHGLDLLWMIQRIPLLKSNGFLSPKALFLGGRCQVVWNIYQTLMRRGNLRNCERKKHNMLDSLSFEEFPS